MVSFWTYLFILLSSPTDVHKIVMGNFDNVDIFCAFGGMHAELYIINKPHKDSIETFP